MDNRQSASFADDDVSHLDDQDGDKEGRLASDLQILSGSVSPFLQYYGSDSKNASADRPKTTGHELGLENAKPLMLVTTLFVQEKKVCLVFRLSVQNHGFLSRFGNWTS